MSHELILELVDQTVDVNLVEHDITIEVHHLAGAGGGSAGFDFTQASPATTWTINHNLGFRPAVELASVGGLLIFGQIQHTSVNQVLVTFNTAQAGTARLA
ncbi:MAG: hypothetical protein ACRCZI_12205 [Cetobacterium sp.]